MLTASSFAPLGALARKIKGELKYHVLHADLWVSKLGQGTEESRARMQTALAEAWPYALGMFEPSDFEEELVSNGVFAGELKLQEVWMAKIGPTIEKSGLTLPSVAE